MIISLYLLIIRIFIIRILLDRMSSNIDISQIYEYLTLQHIGLLLAVIIVISFLFTKKRPKNAPPVAYVGMPILGISLLIVLYREKY